MSFTIPNLADAGFPDQAEPDAQDFRIFTDAAGLTGVVSGCQVSSQGTPDMTVAVASGTILSGGTQQSVTSGNVAIAAADGTNPRFDLIVADSSGAKQRRAGTAAANPVFPAPTAGDVVLAAVYVPAADTAINSNQIVDKRVFVINHLTQTNTWTAANTFSHASGVTTDVVTERTAAAGVTIDGALLKDSGALFTGRVDIAYASTGGQLRLAGGDGGAAFTNHQIQLGYNGNVADYPHFIHTRHNSAAALSAIDFYTNDGTQAGAFPTNALIGLSIENGKIGVGLTGPTAGVHAPATTATRASLCLPHGTAPSSPVNGDMWTTTAGLFVRINGVTKTVTVT